MLWDLGPQVTPQSSLPGTGPPELGRRGCWEDGGGQTPEWPAVGVQTSGSRGELRLASDSGRCGTAGVWAPSLPAPGKEAGVSAVETWEWAGWLRPRSGVLPLRVPLAVVTGLLGALVREEVAHQRPQRLSSLNSNLLHPVRGFLVSYSSHVAGDSTPAKGLKTRCR